MEGYNGMIDRETGEIRGHMDYVPRRSYYSQHTLTLSPKDLKNLPKLSCKAYNSLGYSEQNYTGMIRFCYCFCCTIPSFWIK
jgi:hypothetical protein